MLYRATSDLDLGKKGTLRKGKVFRDSILPEKNISRLREMGIIVEVSSPPLSILPGWKIRSEKASKLGIDSIEDFIQADDASLRETFDVESTTVDSWKDELFYFLDAPSTEKCR